MESEDPGCGLVLRAAAAPLTESGLLDPQPRSHNVAPDECRGKVRPGAAMTSPYGCTFNFVFEDDAANYYVGTAGHCTDRVGQRVSASGVGSFGSVVFRRSDGVHDFSLIRVDDAARSRVSPALCGWGGPIGVDPGSKMTRDVLLEYGWGVATQFAAATRMRVHVESFSNPSLYVEWAGEGSGGDSGAPVVNQAGYAVGSHTYGQTPLLGVYGEGGPSIRLMLDMGRTVVPSLKLALGDPSNVEDALREATY